MQAATAIPDAVPVIEASVANGSDWIQYTGHYVHTPEELLQLVAASRKPSLGGAYPGKTGGFSTPDNCLLNVVRARFGEKQHLDWTLGPPVAPSMAESDRVPFLTTSGSGANAGTLRLKIETFCKERVDFKESFMLSNGVPECGTLIRYPLTEEQAEQQLAAAGVTIEKVPIQKF
jgi:hypothetical protein